MAKRNNTKRNNNNKTSDEVKTTQRAHIGAREQKRAQNHRERGRERGALSLFTHATNGI